MQSVREILRSPGYNPRSGPFFKVWNATGRRLDLILEPDGDHELVIIRYGLVPIFRHLDGAHLLTHPLLHSEWRRGTA